MHEWSIAEDLIGRVASELSRRGIPRATALRVRRSSAFSEDALRTAFASLAPGTALAGARLEVETRPALARCACGRTARVEAADLVGHFWVCPACGTPVEIEEAHDLELINVAVDDRREATT